MALTAQPAAFSMALPIAYGLYSPIKMGTEKFPRTGRRSFRTAALSAIIKCYRESNKSRMYAETYHHFPRTYVPKNCL